MIGRVETTEESCQKLKTSVSFRSSCAAGNLIILYDQQHKIQAGVVKIKIMFQKLNNNDY
jgi:hypothetical protein